MSDSADVPSKSVVLRIPYFPGDALWGLWAVAGVFVITSVVISIYLINKHLKYYTQPNHQRYIVRILCMVPIYGVYSLLSLVFNTYQLYFAFIRDTYEAYVLYMFFALCVEYAGGREALIRHISEKPPLKLAFPLWWKVKTDEKFFKVCQQGMIQYVIIKPIVALWSIVLAAMGLYDDGVFRADRGYFYNTIIINVCVTVALYVVVIFYQSAADILSPYQPLLKFLCIKIVVFFCFWQSVMISVMVHFGWLPGVDGWDVGEVSVGLQNFLICFEMFIISLMHIKAFPAEQYRVQAMRQAPLLKRVDNVNVTATLKAFANSLAQGDMIRDTIDAFRWGGAKVDLGKPDPSKEEDPDANADINLDEFAVFHNSTGGVIDTLPVPDEDNEHHVHFLHSVKANKEGNVAILISDVANSKAQQQLRMQQRTHLLQDHNELDDPLDNFGDLEMGLMNDMVDVLERKDIKVIGAHTGDIKSLLEDDEEYHDVSSATSSLRR
eukprot:TRINITY_DN5031_c0_g1_i1.p1 TRINITY_DN5031_c0_g1~~TRINITY_DN5031_c0_g1_i1.p1  ORF type:complete len:494 (+),score=86.23 TRINITY_DN5031_c0_g1_i1:318-1799(+)